MKKLLLPFLAFLNINGAWADIQLQNPIVEDADEMLNVSLALTDQNGSDLDPSQLFFCVYLNDSTIPFEFTTSEFAYIESAMTEIPYGYKDSNSYDIWNDSAGTVTIYHPGSWSDVTRLGAQAVYHTPEKTYKSDIVYTDGSTMEGDTGGHNNDNTIDESVLISNPEGEKVEIVRTSTVFYRLGGLDIYSGQDTGTATNYVKGLDGVLYLSCVMGGNTTGNYLKLEQSDSSNKFVAKMPQMVMVEEYEDVKYAYYANRLVRENIVDNPDSISYVISPKDLIKLNLPLQKMDSWLWTRRRVLM